MSKLPPKYQFLDLSDYGRTGGKWIAGALQETRFTPIHVTLVFVCCGIVAAYSMIQGQYIQAALFLVLKSVIDAADGELARLKNTPSYVGRYLDSVCDLLLNILFLSTIMFITNTHFFWALLAFIGLQLQGTLYNYYYVILRNNVNGDSTSRVRENERPIALPGEKQEWVTIFHFLYRSLYGAFDWVIYHLDRNAIASKPFPSWFMTLLSVYGLGFQLLLMSLLLMVDLPQLIIPTLLGMTLFLFVFILIRKLFLK